MMPALRRNDVDQSAAGIAWAATCWPRLCAIEHRDGLWDRPGRETHHNSTCSFNLAAIALRLVTPLACISENVTMSGNEDLKEQIEVTPETILEGVTALYPDEVRPWRDKAGSC
jgi:hypothetical protein